MKNLFLINRLIYKYMIGTQNQITLRIMSLIAIMSIAITTATLTLQLFIMNGFEDALNSKMQNIYPDVFITAFQDESFNFEKMNTLFLKQYPEIKACAPSHTKNCFIKKDNEYYQQPGLIKAIDPLLERQVSQLPLKIKDSLDECLTHNGVIIGSKLYDKLQLHHGCAITLIFHDEAEENIPEKNFKQVTVHVTSVIETGISHYDESLIICSLHTMCNLLQDDTISIISFKLHNPQSQLTSFREKIKHTYGYQIDCWQTLYPALVSASQLEKHVSTMILSLMLLVACTTLTAFIFMQIMRKKRDIALLKIIGLSDSLIMYIFMSMGMIITSVAGALGIGSALVIGYILKKYHCIKLPDAYDITHLPIIITFSSVMYVLLLIIILGACATLLAIIHLKNSNSSHALRFEE